MPQVIAARFLRRNSRVRILFTREDQPKAAPPANTGEEAAKGCSSVRKIQSMDISRLKRRIVETMKSIASPRRKKEDSTHESAFLIGISRLFGRGSSRPSCEGQSSNEVEQLYKSTSEGTMDNSNEGNVKAQLVSESKLRVSSRKGSAWRWITAKLLRNRCANFSRRRSSNAESSRGQAWRKTVKVEKLRNTSKTLVNPCRKADSYQTEPLVVPDTPETPGDASETRIQTCDLTVLLGDS